jgi:hypothetical protein
VRKNGCGKMGIGGSYSKQNFTIKRKSMDMPEILYKYRTIDEPTLEIIKCGKIYFPSIFQLNDPFDGSVPYIYDETGLTYENIFQKMRKIAVKEHSEYNERQIHEYISENMKYQNYEEKLNKEVREKIENDFGIYSLTTKRDNLLMWSHYANSHKGICVGFNTKILFKHANSILATITYQECLPKRSIFDADEWKFIQQLLSTKSRVWEYEDEYRLIKINGARKEVFIPLNGLEEIIFGCEIKTSCKEKLKEIIKNNNPSCKLFECSLNKKKFELDIKPII